MFLDEVEVSRSLAERLGALLKLEADQLDGRRALRDYGLDGGVLSQVLEDLGAWLGADLAGVRCDAGMSLEALAAHAARSAAEPALYRGPGEEPIAIVGLGCRFPGAPSPAAYWELLTEGRCARSEIPADRWDVGSVFHPDPHHVGTAHSRFGYFLDRIDQFDPAFFGISPREALLMDPQQRLMLELTWEALEDAGQVPDGLRGSRTGVFFGLIWNDYATLLHRLGFDAIAQHTVTGAHYSLLANRVSYAFGLQGPSLSIDAACSSGLLATHLACQSLRRRESSLALAGGVNLIAAPDSHIVVSKMGAMAPDGLCKAFDARADGFGRGEGGGVVVLKRLVDAQRAGDRIYCVIRGSATNNNGAGDRLTSPSATAQQSVLRAAYRSAGVQPAEVSFVEAHGTGTRIGDPLEAQALGAVLGRERPAEQPLLIGSAKTNVGHLEGASGMAGLLKVALSLYHRALPPSLHFETPNPAIDFAALRLQVVERLRALPASPQPIVAGVNAFGLGGTNCHVVVGSYAEPAAAPSRGPGPHLLTLSANSAAALRKAGTALREHLLHNPGLPLADVCYTRGVRRSHLPHRLAVVADTTPELVEKLRVRLGPEVRTASVPTPGLRPRAPQRPVVFVFPGQGAQWPGMGLELYARKPAFRAALDRCERAFAPYLSAPLLADLQPDAAPERLERPSVIQPLLCALQISLAALWRSHGIVPAAVIGHSMGEVAAAHVAGALSLEDAARIICRRSRLAEEHAVRGGAMAVVELSESEAVRAASTTRGQVAVAAVNGPRTTVLAGDRAALEALCGSLEAAGVFCRFVRVSFASHCHHVDPVAERLRAELADLRPQAPQAQVYSTVPRGDVALFGADHWVENLRREVRLTDALDAALGDGHDLFLELSPHPLLCANIQELGEARGMRLECVPTLRRGEPQAQCFLESLGRLYERGCTVEWTAWAERHRGRLIQLPTYPWQRQRYWAQGLEQAARGGAMSGAAARSGPGSGSGSYGPLPSALSAQTPQISLREVLLREVAAVLMLDAAVIAPASALADLGLDSMMALRLKTRLDQALGCAVSVSALLRGASVASLEASILSPLERREAMARAASQDSALTPSAVSLPPVAPPSVQSLSISSDQIEMLSDEEVERELLQLIAQGGAS